MIRPTTPMLSEVRRIPTDELNRLLTTWARLTSPAFARIMVCLALEAERRKWRYGETPR